jgi:Zn-dependent peptidase ImmA (M78 family)
VRIASATLGSDMTSKILDLGIGLDFGLRQRLGRRRGGEEATSGASSTHRPGARLATLLAKSGVDEIAIREILGPDAAGYELISGERLPSWPEATLLGAFLEMSPNALLGDASESIEVSLRLGAIEGVDDVDDVISHAGRLLGILRLMSSWGLTNESVSPRKLALSKHVHAKTAGRQTARRFRAHLNLGETDPISDLTGLVESLGFPVEHRSMPNRVHGLAVREQRGGLQSDWIVFINSGDSWGRQRYTLAHELCHVLYNDVGQVIVERAKPGEKSTEWRADAFASELVLPSGGVRAVVKDYGRVDGESVAAQLTADLMLHFGASRDATVNVLQDLKLLPASLIKCCRDLSVRELMAKAGHSAEWDRLVRDQSAPAASEKLSRMTLEAFSRELVGINTVADVISDGDIERAREGLIRAGWDVSPGKHR